MSKNTKIFNIIYGGFGGILIILTSLLLGEIWYNSLILGLTHFTIRPSFEFFFKPKKDIIKVKKVSSKQVSGPKITESKKTLKYSSSR